MSGFSSFIKTIFIPLLVAALLYVLVSFVLLPLHRRYVRKYQHYLPLHAASADSAFSTLSSTTSPSWIRARLSGLYSSLSARLPFALPFAATPRTASATQLGGYNDDDDDDFDIDDGEGEGMVGFEPMERERRREALERQRGAQEASRSERRLSRELEEGFRDSSSESENEGTDPRSIGARVPR